MVAVASDQLLQQVAREYPDLGRPCGLAPLTYGFRISNSVFLYRTTERRFLLKAMRHPQALYGEPHVVERLECVAQAVTELHAAGLPVEDIIPTRGGRCVHSYEDALLRLYAFDPGRPFADPDSDTRRSARSLRRLHREGLRCLSEPTRQALRRYERSYALDSNVGRLPLLRAFVEQQSTGSSVFAGILAEWPVVEWAVERTQGHHRRTAEAACVVHTDLHPRNALFPEGRDEAVMVDCDNLMIEPRLKCLGFSILRFAFLQGVRTVEAFRAAVRTFAEDERHDPAFIGDLLHAMISVELEKVLRILQRMMATGHYAGFVDNITPVHLANLQFLRASGEC